MKLYNILFLPRDMNISTGGVIRHVIDISIELKKLGHKIIIASEKGDAIEEFESKGIKYYFCPLGSEKRRISIINLIKSAIVLRKIIKKENVDIIHPQSLYSTVAAFLASKICRIKKIVKTITTFHVLSSQNNFEYAIGSLILQLLSNYTIFVSEYERQQFLSKKILNHKKTCVIPNGIDLSKFGNNQIIDNFRKEYKLENKHSLLGIIARIDKQKGHKYLIEAFLKILKEFPNTKLIIVGEGPLKDSMKSLVKNLKIMHNVIFTDFRKDIVNILKSLDIFILPSLRESLPIVILEAMAAKVPVIATDVGGVAEIITDEATGLLIPPKDVGAIYEAIIKLLKNQSLRKKIIENGYELVESKFSLSKIVSQINKVYDKVMKE